MRSSALFRMVGGIAADLLLTVPTWAATTLGATLLLMWVSPFLGYIPFGDRPGIGRHGLPHGITWAAVSGYTSQTLGYGLYIAPFALWFAFFAYLLVRLSECRGVGRWWIRPLAVTWGILAAALTILSVAWVLALGPLAFWSAVSFGGIFGFVCLPRRTVPGVVMATLLRPVTALDSVRQNASHPIRLWTSLAAIAVLGSLFCGAALAQQLDWNIGGAGLWMALSAGLGWCVLGLVLMISTRQPLRVLAQACLVTMAYGEGVLFVGAMFNLFVRMAHPGWVDAGMIGISNVVMAASLIVQLRSLGVPAWKTLACWMLVLNGSGALFFFLFRHLL